MHKQIGTMVVVVGLWLSGLLGAPATAQPAPQATDALAELRPLKGAAFERRWLTRLLEHHQAVVDLAGLVWEQGTHDDLKTLAQEMIVAHSQAIAELADDLNRWYAQPPPAGRMWAAEVDFATLQGLQGDRFEQEWLRQMQHQQALAVALAALVPDRATHSALRTLAAQQTQQHGQEIAQMRGWLQTWYGMVSPATGTAGSPAAPTGVARTSAGLPKSGQSPRLPEWAGIGILALLLVAGGVRLRQARSTPFGAPLTATTMPAACATLITVPPPASGLMP